MTEPPLRLDAVGKQLGGRSVLSDVSFDCPAGAITALLGPNGAGKTTTVTIATGVRRADSGAVRVVGGEVADRRTRLLMSVVPQDIRFPPALGVDTCLQLVRGQRPPGPCSPESEDLLTRLGVDPLRGRRVGALSGGQRRRLALAMCLLHAPPVVVLDEATSDLDEQHRASTWQLLHEYTARGGCVLVTSHILGDIETHADRVVALRDGTVVLQGSVGDVRARLGGSCVQVTVRPEHAGRISAYVIGLGLGTALPAPRHELRWHTTDALALCARLAELPGSVRDLEVSPVPLADILEQVGESW